MRRLAAAAVLLAGDLARQYQDVSLSIGLWSAYGPAAPVAGSSDER